MVPVLLNASFPSGSERTKPRNITTEAQSSQRTNARRTHRIGYLAETVEIAQDVARKLIEMHIKRRDLLPEVLPSGRIDAVVEMYKSHEISLRRAAEIAGVCFEEFKEILAIKGITRVVEAPCEEEMQRRVDLILGRTR